MNILIPILEIHFNNFDKNFNVNYLSTMKIIGS